ncbi:MAG: RICIN domain-containing protein [Opitutaceae bacterium]|nr:RICIN domain-containing protein [Opitutaceae bacterium]
MKLIRLLLAAITVVAALSQATAQTLVVLVSKHSHKVLTLEDSTSAATAPVVLKDFVGSNNQYWTLHYAGGGAYHVYSVVNAMALTSANTTPDAPIAVAPLNWGDVSQMWDFSTVAFTEKLLYSVNTGMALTPGWRYYATEGGPVLQVPLAQSNPNWLVVPIQQQPTSGSIGSNTGHNESIIWVNQVRNALRVVFCVHSEANGQHTEYWHEAVVNAAADSWDFDRVRIPSHSGSQLPYQVDAFALGADNQWSHLGSSSLVFPEGATFPLHPRMVEVLP